MKKVLLLLAFLTWPTLANSTTYWIATTGNDSNACNTVDGTSDPGTYRLTVAGGLACLSGGDTLKIKDGTYNNTAILNLIPSGSSGAPTVIEGVNTRGATLKAAAGSSRIFNFSSSRKFITIRGLVFDCSTGSATSCAAINFVEGSPGYEDFDIEDNEMKNGVDRLLYASSFSKRINLRRNYVHDVTPELGGNQSSTCYYFQAGFSVIEHNELHDCGTVINLRNATDGAGAGNVVRFNYLHGVLNPLNDPGAGALQVANVGITAANPVLIYGNLIADSLRIGIRLTNAHNTKVWNNTIYGTAGPAGSGIRLDFGNNIEVKNNIIRNTSGTAIVNNLTGASASTLTMSNNVCDDAVTGCTVADPQMIDPAGGNFCLSSSSSAAINQGVAVSGLSFNGSAPDIGACERFTAINAEVGAVNASTIVINFAMNLHTPVQITNTTGWTSTCGTISTITRPVPTRLHLNLASPYGGGGNCAVTYNETTGNARDSALIGNSINQRLSGLSSFTVTDNTGGAPSITRAQSRFRFEHVRGTEASPVVIAAENTSVTLPKGAAFRLRLKFKTDDNPVGANYKLQVSPNSGAYADIPDTMGAALISWYGNNADPDIVSEGTTVTEQLTSDEASNIDCITVRSSQVIPTLDFNNSETECLFFLQISNSAAEKTTYDFRIEGLETYTVTPRVTVGPYVAGSGF